MPVVMVVVVALLIVVVQGLQSLGDGLVRRISNK
jgi:ABC-type methionine transport system permease subunit